MAKKKHTASVTALQNLRLGLAEHEAAVEGKQDGVLGAEGPESVMALWT